MSGQQAFVMEIPANNPAAMAEFQQTMDALNDEHNRYVEKLANEMGVSDACAMDVVYLRSRSRHTPELEKQLIELHAVGTPPNICEFG